MFCPVPFAPAERQRHVVGVRVRGAAPGSEAAAGLARPELLFDGRLLTREPLGQGAEASISRRRHSLLRVAVTVDIVEAAAPGFSGGAIRAEARLALRRQQGVLRAVGDCGN